MIFTAIRALAAPLLALTALLTTLPAALPTGASAAPCREESFEGAGYIVCSFDLTRAKLRTFWQNKAGEPYASFTALAADLKSQGLTLDFAMNGGMYDEKLRPVGLYVEDGEEKKAANTADAGGNFHMKPNGVFYMVGGKAGVMETGAYLDSKMTADFATQSGPMLVINGAIHPRFIAGSDSLKPRDGVGVSSPTMVHFAISKGAVNFEEFARFFRDRLGCPNALFLDGGSAPGLFAPELSRNDSWSHYGPIIAVVE